MYKERWLRRSREGIRGYMSRKGWLRGVRASRVLLGLGCFCEELRRELVRVKRLVSERCEGAALVRV